MSQHVIVPAWARWVTPRAEHIDEAPFCDSEICLCKFDGEHMERHFVRPVALGQITPEEAFARYRGKRVEGQIQRETALTEIELGGGLTRLPPCDAAWSIRQDQ